MRIHSFALFLLVAAVLTGCGEPSKPATAAPHKHEHKPPHGGTPVVLGDEEFHLELVADVPEGRLTAFVMDGELENFVRVPATSFTVVVPAPPPERRLVFKAVGNPASGIHIFFGKSTKFSDFSPTFALEVRIYTQRSEIRPGDGDVAAIDEG